jgi:dihydrofolate reductase
VNGARLSLIAAVARNGVIGRDNQIPWRLPSDLKRFKALTLGHPVVMGRKTFQSIGRPLPGRDNIVVSRHGFRADGALVVSSLDEGLELAQAKAGQGGEVFVIGGAEIYRETLPLADRLYITEVDVTPAGDATFPGIDGEVWRIVQSHDWLRPEGDSAPARLVVYDRLNSPPG